MRTPREDPRMMLDAALEDLRYELLVMFRPLLDWLARRLVP